MICLQDPGGIIDNAVFVFPDVLFIISLFDGQHSLLDIQSEYMRQYGELLFKEKLYDIIEGLDSNFLLDSEKFRVMQENLRDDFNKSPVRKAFLAGRGYKSDECELRKQIESYFASHEGPGMPVLGEEPKQLKGIVAPHIDFQRGGKCYAFAHKEVGEAAEVDVFIILGTAHRETKNFFVLTRKDFETPLGRLETDKTFISSLEEEYSGPLFDDEFIHQGEHSIEFQLIFLQYLYQNKKKFKIVPILCGSFHQLIYQNQLPSQDPQIHNFLTALKKTISSCSGIVCLIASADLAHMGLPFGDRFPITPEVLQKTSSEDLRMLQYVEKLDPDGFYLFVQRERDKRRICGLSPIYTMLSAMHGATRGKLLKYDQWKDPKQQSTVTFTGLAFY